MKHDFKDVGPTACDACAFQVLNDNSSFFCIRKSPDAQAIDGRAQWPKLERGGSPVFKGCGEGQRRKDNA
jgi:hypothetical protein